MKGKAFQKLLEELKTVNERLVLEVELPKYQNHWRIIDKTTKQCYGLITPAVISLGNDYCNLEGLSNEKIICCVKEMIKKQLPFN